MRIVASTVPSWGHVVPMLGLLNALRVAGHEVLIATHVGFHTALRELGFDTIAAGMSESDMLAARASRWPQTQDRPPREWAARMFREIAAPRVADDLGAAFGDDPPDLVIAEEGEYGAAAFAAEARVPFVRHGWGSPGLNATLDAPVLAHVDPCPASLQTATSEPTQHWPVRLEPPRLVQRNTELEHWLDERPRPVAYVSLGTVPLYADAPGVITGIVDALLNAGLDVVLTTSATLAPWSAERVRVERMVELADVLPRCVVVACHAGAGTVLSALAHGLPLVLVPRGAPSQLRMATACARVGVARVVDDRADVAVAVGDILGNTYVVHARGVAEEMAKMPSPATVAELLTAS